MPSTVFSSIVGGFGKSEVTSTDSLSLVTVFAAESTWTSVGGSKSELATWGQLSHPLPRLL